MENPSVDDINKRYKEYNPYEGNIHKLPTTPQFLFEEEAKIKHRSLTDNLAFYTGSGYLTGGALGFLEGSLDGLRAAEPGETLKLRASRALSTGGQLGVKWGNTLGLLGLMYAGFESSLIDIRGENSDDLLNSVAAGLGTGVLFKASAGLRSAAIARAVGAVVAGAAEGVKQAARRYWDVSI